MGKGTIPASMHVIPGAWAASRLSDDMYTSSVRPLRHCRGRTTADGSGDSFFNMDPYLWLKVNLEGMRFANEGSGVYDWSRHAGCACGGAGGIPGVKRRAVPGMEREGGCVCDFA